MTADICELFLELSRWAESIGIRDANKVLGLLHAEFDAGDGETISVALNAHPNPTEEGALTVPPFHAAITSSKYLAVAIVGPYGGLMGGFLEDALIDKFKAAAEAKRGRVVPSGGFHATEIPAKPADADPA